ncbi:hypothetical protein P154DRAFT_188484 [Amniculicola lignicola CBS 123094]|uniref:Extracellular membrane protein CFEM domain-containing protein n=1 Tax=Amniculicola lignicola CBS 123094 TaxID=1392246 RepID=A0A6A5WKY8_9PLEO|nr:hypothetical protein P154DRAFT_188484 [Amniculicola lignicola CBS 123094]
MRSVTRTIMIALVASSMAAATDAISLSDFTPRLLNLPRSCQDVYTEQVDGCQAGDFSTANNNRCSASCVTGLLKISQEIGVACAFVDVPDNSIIGVFLAGAGIPALCPGVTVTTIAPSSTQAQSTPARSSTEASTTSEAPSSSTSTAAPSSASGAISVDTSFATSATGAAPSAPVQSAASTGSSSSARPRATGNSQKSNKDSGGGSPFDVQATGGSPSLRTLGSAAMATMIATAVVFSVLF